MGPEASRAPGRSSTSTSLLASFASMMLRERRERGARAAAAA
jgi:hypothetical protein